MYVYGGSEVESLETKEGVKRCKEGGARQTLPAAGEAILRLAQLAHLSSPGVGTGPPGQVLEPQSCINLGSH